ncbi:MAG TPA: deoxyribonuclease V [Burkholderiales bacterium]|nr:deoxyribonuclease V [Burkholderiales bacterium]
MKKIWHSWNLTPRAAIAVQQRLRSRVVRRGHPRAIRTVAGTDVGFERGGAIARAAVAVLSFPGLELVDYAVARRPARFPYVPGLLSFREMPALLAALARLRVKPDLVLCDGQGLAHPRRFGLACHLGVMCGMPSIGVAKSRLIGKHREPGERRGTWVPLRDRGETIGAVVRSRAGTRPIFVSIGHRVSLPVAVRYVMACTTRFRLPETTRWAHRLASGGEPPARHRRDS